MEYYIEGILQENQKWIQGVLGDCIDIIDSVEVEERVFYFNCVSGMVVVMRGTHFHPDIYIDFKNGRGWKKPLANIRAFIIAWHELMDSNLIKAMNFLERWPRRKVTIITTPGSKEIEMGIGDLPGTRRDYTAYRNEQDRKYRKDWLPEELPLCPECIKTNSGYGPKDRNACKRHLWLNESVYDGWGLMKGRSDDYPSRKHVSGPIKAHTIQPKPPEPRRENIRRKTESTPIEGTVFKINVGNQKPAPSDFLDAELLKNFGNRQIRLYQSACGAFERESHRYSNELREWASKCLERDLQYINQLRERLVELEEHVEKSPKNEHVEETCTDNQHILFTSMSESDLISWKKRYEIIQKVSTGKSKQNAEEKLFIINAVLKEKGIENEDNHP